MHFHFSFYSSILLIFFSQGVIFSYLLLKKGIQTDNLPSKWLSLFVFLCSIYLLPWLLGFAGWYSIEFYRNILFYVPVQHLFLIGPSIYFYTKSLLNPSFRFKRKDYVHFAPAIFYLIYRLIIFAIDIIILKESYFYANGRDKNLDNWYQISGFLSMTLYYLLSLKYYTIYEKIIKQTLSFTDMILFSWIKKYLLAFLFMQLLWLLFFLFYPDWGNFKEKWWYYLFFSMLLYYIGITGYVNNIKALIPFRFLKNDLNTIYLLGEGPNINSIENNSTVSLKQSQVMEANQQIEIWKGKIIEALEKDKLYKNPKLTLQDLADHLETNQTLISKMVNQGFGINFNDFINEFRIKEVIFLLQKGAHKKHTLLGIAIDSGFNSKSTFNRCFKKFTGKPPKDFIENLNSNLK